MIIGVDQKQTRLDLARELGATHIIDTSDMSSVTSQLAAAIGKVVPAGASAIFDTTGALPLIQAGVQALKARGEMILIGIVTGKTLELDLGILLNVCNIGNRLKTLYLLQTVWCDDTWLHRRQRKAP